MADLKKRLHDLRVDQDLSMKKLADMVGTQQSRISDIEHGKGYIHADDLPKYAEALQTTVSYLVTGNQPDNETIADDLGLSNLTITELCSIHRMSKLNEKQPELQSYYQNKLRVIDCLLKDQSLLDTIAGYLFRDFSEFHVINETGLYTATLTKNGTFTEEDNAALFKLRIMDKLSALRDSLKGGNAK